MLSLAKGKHPFLLSNGKVNCNGSDSVPRLTHRDIQRLSPEARTKIRQALRSSKPTRREGLSNSETEHAPSKYHNVRTTVDGITFASGREAKRYTELKLELLAGTITDLELQKPFSLDINGIHICDYIADFVYRRDGKQVIEDAKGKRLELFRIKKALMLAIHGIAIVEV